jgi:hypothetical protein
VGVPPSLPLPPWPSPAPPVVLLPPPSAPAPELWALEADMAEPGPVPEDDDEVASPKVGSSLEQAAKTVTVSEASEAKIKE